MPSISRAGLVLAAAFVLLPPGPALAQAKLVQAEPAAKAPAAQAQGPLRVWVDAPSESLDRVRLQQSLSRELAREVVLSSEQDSSVVQIVVESPTRAKVRYTTPSGEHLVRSVELPADRERSLQVLSWLTVNLVRDEASELLDELRARRKEDADARAAAEKADHEAALQAKAEADKAAAAKAAADKAAADAARKKQLERATPAKPARDELLRDPLRSFDLALATPLSLIRDSARRELRLQLALGYGESGAIHGVAASPSVLRIRQDLDGVAVAAAFLQVGGDAQGALVSVGYARVEGKLDGAALGVGIASARSLHGVITSGGITLLRDASRGIALAGGANVAREMTGIQLAGGINVARELRGIALAPINAHQRVRGVQIGVVNIADEVDGAAIGIVSLAKNGRLQPVLWGSNDRSAHLALKSIVGYVFTQLGGGVELNGANFSYDGGAGAHLKLSEHFFVEPGVHYSATLATADASGSPDTHTLSYLLTVGFRAGSKLDVLLGAGARHIILNDAGTHSVVPELRGGIAFF